MAEGKRNWLRKMLRVFAWLFILQILYIVFCKWVNPPVTLTQMGSVISGHGLKRDYVSYSEMSPHIKLAVMAGEDQLFPDHDGFDLKAIKKAMKYNEKHPTRRRGASTISQQVAKNVFLWQGGGYFRKGLEVYFTFMIEKAWSKKRILQTYLNVAEMGPGIFGVQAAAKAYFKNRDRLILFKQCTQLRIVLEFVRLVIRINLHHHSSCFIRFFQVINFQITHDKQFVSLNFILFTEITFRQSRLQ